MVVGNLWEALSHVWRESKASWVWWCTPAMLQVRSRGKSMVCLGSLGHTETLSAKREEEEEENVTSYICYLECYSNQCQLVSDAC